MTQPTILIDRRLAEAELGPLGSQHWLVKSADGASLRQNLESVQLQFPIVRLLNQETALANTRSKLAQTTAIVLAVEVVILIGASASLITVVSTVLSERRREFGQLRAAGATAKQVVRLVSLEIGLVCINSTVLALVIGGMITWALLRLMEAPSPIPSPTAAAIILVGFSLLAWLAVRLNTRSLQEMSVIASQADE